MSDAEPVRGTPTDEEAVVIAAAVSLVLAEESAARTLPEPVLPSDWVLASRPRPFHAPLPADLYDAMGGWGTVDENEDQSRF